MISYLKTFGFFLLAIFSFQSLAANLPARIELIPTARTAFVGEFEKGPYNAPTIVKSWSDFLSRFSQKTSTSVEEEQVRLYFANGGREASIVRIKKSPQQRFLVAPLTAESYLGDAKKRTGVYALERNSMPIGLLVFPGANNLSPTELFKLQKQALLWGRGQ
ncbi:tail sheath protein [Bdellovibrio bacteriovorus W]|nr:tail sheath protein [Bdellovibrio bacteriovorus W]